MDLKNSKRKKNGFTMVELLAVVAILGVIVAIAVPVSLSYVRNSRDKAFYLNVQEIVKKVKMEHELNIARHCYHNISIEDIEDSESANLENFNQISDQTIGDLKLVSLVDKDKVEHLSILSYLDDNDKIKYAVLAKEKDTDNWIDVLDFDGTTSEKSSWKDNGASYVINILSNAGFDDDGYNDEEDKLSTSFGSGKNKLENYKNDYQKCKIDFKEGN